MWLAIVVAAAVPLGVHAYFEINTARQQLQLQDRDGRQLYSGNCASCHGANLEGQPDWMRRKEDGRMPAPPHDASGHTWHHSDGQLFRMTKFGLQAIVPGYQSDMPAFENKLTDHEIISIFDYIKSTWPERERAFQVERSRADQ